jgi:hypothetical protein
MDTESGVDNNGMVIVIKKNDPRQRHPTSDSLDPLADFIHYRH